MTVTSNGHHPDPLEEDGPLASLRAKVPNVHLFGGFGPLVVGIILFVLMVLLAPTIAPEQVVERPVNDTTVEVAP